MREDSYSSQNFQSRMLHYYLQENDQPFLAAPIPSGGPPEKQTCINLMDFLSGAIAGVCSRMVTAPIDMLKIRFQMETAVNPNAKQYRGIMQSLSTIYKQEGLLAFWKGNMAGIWLYGTFSGVQFWVFDHAKNAVPVGPAGGLAAMTATIFTYPFDLVRTRMALHLHHSSLLGTMKHIMMQDGIGGFYKGIGPTLSQVIPYMGLSFYIHHWTKAVIMKTAPEKNHMADLIAGGAAGIISKTVMMPVDVVRKRLQIQGSAYQEYAIKNVPRYSGMTDCIRTMWKAEGPIGFYRGLSLAICKSGPATATTFLVYGLMSSFNNRPK